MHVYNAIIVLKEILPVFPLATVLDAAGSGVSLDRAIDELIETEERGDLKILARAYVHIYSHSCLDVTITGILLV